MVSLLMSAYWKVAPKSIEVVLAEALYNVCPEQFVPHFDEGRSKSLLVVSNGTVRHSINCGNSDPPVLKR